MNSGVKQHRGGSRIMEVSGIYTGRPRFKQRSPTFLWGRYSPYTNDIGGFAWKDLSLRGVSPTRLYIGPRAVGSTWTEETGTDDATLQAGTPVYNVDGPGPSVSGVGGDGTAYFKGSSGPSTGTNDIIAAVALQWDGSASTHYYCGTYDDGTTEGWLIYKSNSTPTFPRLFFGANSTFEQCSGSTIADGQIAVIVGCVNRDEGSTNGAFCFTNAIAGSGIDFSGTNVAPSNELPLQLFAGDGLSIFPGTIYAVGLWLGANLFSAGATGAAEMAAVAGELTQRFFGTYPQKASTGNYLNTITRATEDGMSVDHSGVKKLFYMGSGGIGMDDEGLPVLGATTNKVSYSVDINSWGNKAQITATLNQTGPDGFANSATLITEDATDDWHSAAQALGALEAEWYELVILIKSVATGRDYVRLIIYDTAGETKTAGYHFDYKNGSVGSQVAATWSASDPTIEDWGNSYYLCRCYVLPSAEAATCQIVIADADPAATYQGDSRNVCHIAHVQVAKGKYRHSLIRTSGAVATRNALDINFDADNIPAGNFTITGEFRLPPVATPIAAAYLFDINDGTTDNQLALYAAATTGYITYTVAGSASSASDNLGASFGNAFDGNWHTFTIAYQSGSTYLRVDSIDKLTSHGKTIGTRSSMEVGRDVGDAAYLNGHLRNIRIYNVYDVSLK